MSYPPNITTDPTQNDFSDIAFIALGSNLPSKYGSPVETLCEAMDSLQKLSQRPLLRSSIWLSEPIGCPDNSPQFANAVIGLFPQSGESPESLLKKLLELESIYGRQRSGLANEPRVLDLDLVTFEHREMAQQALTLPHPAAQSRGFVLFPLQEIAPDFVIPGQNQSVSKLADILRHSGIKIEKINP